MASADTVRKVVTDAVSAGVNAGMAITQTARDRAEDLAALVRQEIAAQLASMGLATRQDLADLEARMRAERAGTGPEPTAEPAPKPKPRPKPTATRRRPPAASP